MISDFFTGELAVWLLATPVGNWIVLAAVTVVSVASSLQLILRGAAQLAKLTDAEWDDRAVARAQKVVDKTLAAARAVVTGDPDMFKKLGAILRPE